VTEETPQAPRALSSRRRRLAIWLGGSAAALLAVFVLVVFVLPTPVARYVIESQLEELGIRHDGIDTVEIDLWNSQVHAGPVRFHSGEADQGQIGETGFDYSFGALFEGRAFIQTFRLSGVDLRITRLEDGAIEVNGVNLQQLGGGEAEEEVAAETPAEEEGEGFGFGVESFEFTDSQLVFQDVSGGILTIELEQLTLDRLQTWTPEQPTAFSLTGRLNDMVLNFDGTVTPLADPLLVTFHSRVQGITLERISRFIGPTGLAREEGEVSTDVSYDYAIYKDGRIDGSVEGTYSFQGFEIATAEGDTVSLPEAVLKIGMSQALKADGSVTAQGEAKLTGAPLAVSSSTGDSLRIGSLDFSIEELDFAKGTETRRRLLGGDEAPAGAGAKTGRVPTIVDLMIGWARELGTEVLNHQLDIHGEPSLVLKDGEIRLAARDGDPGHQVRFDSLSVDLGEVVTEAFDLGVEVSSPLEAVIAGLSHATGDGRISTAADELRLSSDAVRFDASVEETALVFDLALALRRISASGTDSGSVNVESLTLTTPQYTIRETPTDQVAEGDVSATFQALSASLTGPDGATRFQSSGLSVALAPFSLAGKQGEAARFGGSLEIQDITLNREGESPLDLSLATARSDFDQFQVAPLTAEAAFEGGVTTRLSDLRLASGVPGQTMTFELASLENVLEGLSAGGFDSETPQVALASRTTLSDLKAQLNLAEDAGAESLDLELAALENVLEGLNASGFTGDDPQLSLASRTTLSDLKAELSLPAGAAAETVNLQLTSLENELEGLDARGFTGETPQVSLASRTTLSDLKAELSLPDGAAAETVNLQLTSLENELEGLDARGFTGADPQLSLASRTTLNDLKAQLSLPGGESAEAALASFEAPLSEIALDGDRVSAKGALEFSGFSAASQGELPQSLDIASLSITGLSGDSAEGATAGSIALGEVVAKLALPGAADETADEVTPAAGEAATAEAPPEGPKESPVAGLDRRFAVDSFSVAPGSRIEITDNSVEPPLQANIRVERLTAGPIDTAAPETRTDLTLALTANENSKVELQGWAAPLKARPDFELASNIEGLSLTALSPYAAKAVGVNVESGALTAKADARAAESALGGKIDLRINDLFVTPLTEAEAEKLKAEIGLPVGFAVSILKNRDGVIAFGLPLSGTVEDPQVDYSEAINKAISGAMASVFPTNWFGPDGNTFKMQPAVFAPGTSELTLEGMEVADEMGELFTEKPGISIRACGRAGRADLVALRDDVPEGEGDTVMPAGAPAADAPASGPDAAPQDGAPQDAATAALPPATEKDIAAPNDQEIQALLALATERGLAVRKYLEAKHGVDPGKIPECRTAYSIEDGKPPRAEFQF
jgi:hypothetical protein